MNGTRITRRNETIFLPLPASQQRPCDGCHCDWCKAHPDFEPAWDTIAIDATGARGYSWTVHYPEICEEHLSRFAPRSPEELEARTREILGDPSGLVEAGGPPQRSKTPSGLVA